MLSILHLTCFHQNTYTRSCTVTSIHVLSNCRKIKQKLSLYESHQRTRNPLKDLHSCISNSHPFLFPESKMERTSSTTCILVKVYHVYYTYSLNLNCTSCQALIMLMNMITDDVSVMLDKTLKIWYSLLYMQLL